MDSPALTRAALAAVALLAIPTLQASAATITEEYTGSQFVDRGETFTFDFDLWNPNSWPVNDNAPDMSLTTDGTGALGAWSGASLYIDFFSTDPEADIANIDVDAWTFRFLGAPIGGTDVWSLSSFNVSRPSGGSNLYLFNYAFTPSQVSLLDNYGGGMVSISATRSAGSTNDFEIRRVGMQAVTGDGVSVPEPGTLSVLGAGLVALGLAARRRRSARA